LTREGCDALIRAVYQHVASERNVVPPDVDPRFERSGVQTGRFDVRGCQSARRIVVKVGSSLVTNEGRGIDPERSRQLVPQMAALAAQDREIVMVSSGAIAEGMKRLGWAVAPKGIHNLQAAAAVGQMGLAQIYETELRKEGIHSAQVLLTHADLADRERYLNARSTLLTLAGPACHSGHQRERHRRQRRNQVRR
jgi:hypothetical protein